MTPRFPPARGRKKPGQMNGYERKYADILDQRVAAGEVVTYWYERWTFKLADDTRYTPDFVLLMADGTLQAHEVKGGLIRDDARVKFKVAADQFPIAFFWCVYKHKQWTITTPYAEDAE